MRYGKKKIRTNDILHSQTHHAESICLVVCTRLNRVGVHDERSFRVSTDMYIVITDHYDTAARGGRPVRNPARRDEVVTFVCFFSS